MSKCPTDFEIEKFTLEPADTKRLANLCGQFNGHLKQIEQRLAIKIKQKDNLFELLGKIHDVKKAKHILNELYKQTLETRFITSEQVHLTIQQNIDNNVNENYNNSALETLIVTRKKSIKVRGQNQSQYIKKIGDNDVTMGVGPAGTGKTYLAVACAVQALEQEEVQRILLTRPAVEAGEKLGFLPGDLTQKVDPYLRPLYDALYDMLGTEKTYKLIEQNIIEIAPLAYMRGRTLNNSFIILDEAQNTTIAQIKMFLTRIGFGSKTVLTGDLTQIDLPPNVSSGFRHAIQVLQQVKEVGVTYFTAKDIVRHPVVQKIVMAFENYDLSTSPKSNDNTQKTPGSV